MPMDKPVDIDELLNKWSEIWFHDNAKRSSLEWNSLTTNDKSPNQRIASNTSFKDRVHRNYPNCTWPPQLELAVIDDSPSDQPVNAFDQSSAVRSEKTIDIGKELKDISPEMLFAYSSNNLETDSSFKKGSDNTFTFLKKFNKTFSVKTGFQFSMKLKTGIKILGTGFDSEFGIALNREKEVTVGKEVSINQTINLRNLNNTFVLEAHKKRCLVENRVALSGYFVVAATKKFIPGKDYAKNIGTAHKKWVVPIYQIFDDLKSYVGQNKLSRDLEDQIGKFTIDETNERVVGTLQLECEVVHDYCLNEYLGEKVKKQFEPQIDESRSELLEHNKYGHRIERLFYGNIPIQKYYAELNVVEGIEFTSMERRLKSASKSASGDDAEALLIYGQLTGECKVTLAYQQLLPSHEEKKWCILVTGTAGVGKTTLSKKLASEATDWCFYIPIRNLNCDRYPEREDKPYTVAEILIKEGYPPNLSNRIMPFLNNNLWENYLEILVTGDKKKHQKYFGEVSADKNDASPKGDESSPMPQALVILDGYDEKNIPDYLEHVFSQLMNARRLVLTSRPYNLDGLKDVYSFEPSKWVEVTGFSEITLSRYIDDFFESLSSGDDEANAQNLKAQLDSSPYIKGACKIPVNCEMVCTAWASGDFDQGVTTMGGLYNGLLESLSKRYIAKFKRTGKSDQDMDAEEIRKACKFEVAFAEYFAFNSLVQRKFFSDTIAARKYLPSEPTEVQHDALLMQKRFGFIKPSSEYNHSGKDNYYFSHLTFRDYFAARYIVNALQEESGSQKMRLSEYFSEFYLVDNDNVKQKNSVSAFIQERKFEPSFEYVLWFVAGLLTNKEDLLALSHFYRCLLDKPRDLTGIYSATLFVRCLDESNSMLDKIDSRIIERLFSVVFQWLKYFFSEKQLERDIVKAINPLWERLKLSKNLLRSKKMTDFILEAIKGTDKYGLQNILRFLLAINFATLDVVRAIVVKLSKFELEEKSYYHDMARLLVLDISRLAFLEGLKFNQLIIKSNVPLPNSRV